jgi:hypothetical protein
VEAKACSCDEALVVLDNEVGCMLVMLVKPYFACRSSLNKAFPTRVPCQKPESTDLNQDFGGQIPRRLRKLSNPSPHPTPKCIDQVHGYYAEPRARSGCFGFGGIIRGKKLYAVFSRTASCLKGPYERVCRADPDTRIKKKYIGSQNSLCARACAPSTIGNSLRSYNSLGKRLHRQPELRQPATKARQEAAKFFSWKFPSCFRQYSRCPGN